MPTAHSLGLQSNNSSSAPHRNGLLLKQKRWGSAQLSWRTHAHRDTFSNSCFRAASTRTMPLLTKVCPTNLENLPWTLGSLDGLLSYFPASCPANITLFEVLAAPSCPASVLSAFFLLSCPFTHLEQSPSCTGTANYFWQAVGLCLSQPMPLPQCVCGQLEARSYQPIRAAHLTCMLSFPSSKSLRKTPKNTNQNPAEPHQTQSPPLWVDSLQLGSSRWIWSLHFLHTFGVYIPDYIFCNTTLAIPRPKGDSETLQSLVWPAEEERKQETSELQPPPTSFNTALSFKHSERQRKKTCTQEQLTQLGGIWSNNSLCY